MKEKVSPTQKALNVWAIVLILWSFYRAYFRQDLPQWFDELIVKPFFFVLPVYWYVRKVEKKQFAKAVYLRTKNILPDIVLGAGLGAVFFTVGLLSFYLKSGSFSLGRVFNIQIFVTLIIAFATSFSEELLSRGFVLRHLWEDSRNYGRAILVSSALFFFLHIPMLLTTPGISGAMLLQVMVTDIALSVAVSFLFLQRKSLLVAVIVHAFYTLSLSVFLQ